MKADPFLLEVGAIALTEACISTQKSPVRIVVKNAGPASIEEK